MHRLFVIVSLIVVLIFFNSSLLILKENVLVINKSRIIFKEASLHTKEIYDIREDVIRSNLDERSDITNSGANLALDVVYLAMSNDYKQITDLAIIHPHFCRSSPACRYLAGKASMRINNDEIAIQLWANDISLWRYLIGSMVLVPRSEQDLQFLMRYYKILQRIRPNDAAPYFMLGSLHRSVGQWDKSLAYYEQAASLEPETPRYLCALGVALVYSERDVERGVNLCRIAHIQAPQDMWLQREVANTFAIAGDCKAALGLYEEIARKFSNRDEPKDWLKEFREGQIEDCIVDQ